MSQLLIESFAQSIPSKALIHSGTKYVTLFMNESINHWIICSIYSFKSTDSFRNSTFCVAYDSQPCWYL